MKKIVALLLVAVMAFGLFGMTAKAETNDNWKVAILTGTVVGGKEGTASHAQADDNRGNEDHQRVGRANGCQRICPDALSHNQRIYQIVDLLQEISCDHRQGKSN